MSIREDFEAWIDSGGLRRLCSGDDSAQGILIYWECWKAARASLVVDLPTSISFGHDWLMNGKDVEDAIHATGARTK